MGTYLFKCPLADRKAKNFKCNKSDNFPIEINFLKKLFTFLRKSYIIMDTGREVLQIDKISWSLSMVASLELVGLIVCGVKLSDANKKLSEKLSVLETAMLEQQLEKEKLEQKKLKQKELEQQLEYKKKEAQERYSQLESENKQLLSLVSQYKEALEKYSQLESENKQLLSLAGGHQDRLMENLKLQAALADSKCKLESLKFAHRIRLYSVRESMETVDKKCILIGCNLVDLSYEVKECMEKIGEDKGMNSLVQEQLPWLLTGRKIFKDPNEDGAGRKLAEQRLLDALVVGELDSKCSNGPFNIYYSEKCPRYVSDALKALGKAYTDYNDALNFGSESDVPEPLAELRRFCLRLEHDDVEVNDVNGNDLITTIRQRVEYIIKVYKEVKQLEAEIENSLTPKSEDSST